MGEGFHRIFLNDNPYGVPASWNDWSGLNAVGDSVRLNEGAMANSAWTFQPPKALDEKLPGLLRQLGLHL